MVEIIHQITFPKEEISLFHSKLLYLVIKLYLDQRNYQNINMLIITINTTILIIVNINNTVNYAS